MELILTISSEDPTPSLIHDTLYELTKLIPMKLICGARKGHFKENDLKLSADWEISGYTPPTLENIPKEIAAENTSFIESTNININPDK